MHFVTNFLKVIVKKSSLYIPISYRLFTDDWLIYDIATSLDAKTSLKKKAFKMSSAKSWGFCLSLHVTNLVHTHLDGILPKGPYPPCLRMADRALLAGYPRPMVLQWPWHWIVYEKRCHINDLHKHGVMVKIMCQYYKCRIKVQNHYYIACISSSCGWKKDPWV